jgi:glycerophosphoryl diester phosphodiesterase
LVVIAHRGASAYCPENTMAAFKKALELDADMIELDVVLSKDGVPVVFHDAKLNHHTSGRGAIGNYQLKDLKKLDAGSWFDIRFSDQTIPTLEEVLSFAAGNIAINIEIKQQETAYPDGYIEAHCLEMVEKYGMSEYILISSFDYSVLEKVGTLNPEIPRALLYDRKQSSNMLPHELVQKYRVDAFNCSYRELTKKRMDDLKKHHIPSFIYTVDQENKMRKLIDFGVSGIFTNRPDVLKGVVESYQR